MAIEVVMVTALGLLTVCPSCALSGAANDHDELTLITRGYCPAGGRLHVPKVHIVDGDSAGRLVNIVSDDANCVALRSFSSEFLISAARLRHSQPHQHWQRGFS